MEKQAEQKKVQQPGNQEEGNQRVAQNPNPRANANLQDPANVRGKDGSGQEMADMEDEVGTEITDGEDA